MRINRVDIYYLRIPLAVKLPGFFAAHPCFSQADSRLQADRGQFYLTRLITDTDRRLRRDACQGTERFGLGNLIGPSWA